MSVEREIFDRLQATAAVTELVSTRTRLGALVQGEKVPAVMFARVSATRWQKGGKQADVMQARFQFDCYAWAMRTTTVVGVGNVFGARNVFDAVRAALDHYSTSSGTIIQGILWDTDQDLVEQGGKDTLYRVSADAFVYYEE